MLDGFINGSHHDDVLKGAADDRKCDFQLGGAAHHGGEASVLHNVLHGIVTESIVQGHGGDTLAVSSLLRKNPFSAVLGEEADHAAAWHQIQVAYFFVARARKSHVDKTFADVHCFRVSVTVVEPHIRTSITSAAASSRVARAQALASAAVHIGTVLEVVVQRSKARSDCVDKAFDRVGVAISRATGSGGLEVLRGDGVLYLRSRFGSAH